MAMMMLMLVTLLVTHTRAEGGQCEEIQIPMCKDIGYNFTRLPNEFNHESQDEVSIHLTTKKPTTFHYSNEICWLNLICNYDMKDSKARVVSLCLFIIFGFANYKSEGNIIVKHRE